MNMNFRGPYVAAMVLSASLTALADQGATPIGDMAGYGEDAYFAEEADYTQPPMPEEASVAAASYIGDDSSATYVGDTAAGGGGAVPSPPHFAPGPGGKPHPELVAKPQGSWYPDASVTHHGGMPSTHRGCDGSCDGSCDSGCGGSSRLGRLFDGDGKYWGQTEVLLWFPQARETPPLITTSAPGDLGVLPAADVAFGGEIDGGMSVGYRGDMGRYLTDQIGIGGRYWILHQNSEVFSAQGDGTGNTIARPFFNLDVDANDALLVNQAGTFAGSVWSESELDLWGAELYARARFFDNAHAQLDFIGGYTRFDIEDNLRISSTTISTGTAQTRTFRDTFSANNRFDGGQIGFDTKLCRGRWMVRSLTKVHLGNMNQRVLIRGQSTDVTPPAAPTVSSGGFLASSNQGLFERDEFAFAPEVNFKLGYRFRKHVALTVGYSFIYWDNVALAGEHVDPVVDVPAAFDPNNGATRPEFDWNDSGLWVQGVDLGVVIDF